MSTRDFLKTLSFIHLTPSNKLTRANHATSLSKGGKSRRMARESRDERPVNYATTHGASNRSRHFFLNIAHLLPPPPSRAAPPILPQGREREIGPRRFLPNRTPPRSKAGKLSLLRLCRLSWPKTVTALRFSVAIRIAAFTQPRNDSLADN